MGKVKGKHRLDKYYRLAKEHGYRSRASWKLVQLDAKFSFLRSSRAVLDLCAAPGGWMQVAVQRAPVGSLVLGIDLVPIAPIRGAESFEQDITKSECRSKIKHVMDKHGVRAFDLVLHDGSPNVGGAWSQEAMSQNALVIDSVRLATQFLAPKGTFVTKIFRSQDYNSVLYCLNQLFEKVEVDKPAASRLASAEIFLVGLKYKAPAKIDPRLLDVRHLFQGAIEPPKKVVDVLKGAKQKRHRDGYEEGESMVRKVASASDFIWSESPLELLGTVTSISFDDQASLAIKDNALSTDEVKLLCDDLGVLGKNDFKYLLKWRMQIRKALSPSQKEAPTKGTEEKENEEGDDDKLLNELEDLTSAMDRKKKREKKVIAKRRAKDKIRKSTGMQIDVMEDGYMDNDLFSLSSIKGKKELGAVDNDEYDGNDAIGNDSDNGEGSPNDTDDSVSDSEEERKKYDETVEEILDAAYERYLTKQEGTAKQRKRARQAHFDNLEDGDGDEEMQSDHDSDRNEDEDDANPLMVPLDDGVAFTNEEIANKWFSQDIFAQAVEEGDLGKEDSANDEMQVEHILEKPVSVPKKSKEKAAKLDQTQPMQVEHIQEKPVSIPKKSKEKTAKLDQTQAKKTNKNDDDFEIVAAPQTDSSSDSSSDESDDDDVYKKAEILACAKKMLRKKQREEILDDSYNKYMFHDEGLPKWFLEEEKKHRQLIKPVTKEEIAAMKAQFREINARPAKKVAQAKARKKRSAMKKLEKVRKKANNISDQADVSERSKSKMIEQLYKKATPKRPQKEYVVAKKGVKVRAGKGKILVDRRMKKDARQSGMGKSGRSGNKGNKNAKGQKGKGPMKGSATKGKKGK